MEEFKACLREPPSGKPRPQPSVIIALEKLTECGHDVFMAFSCKRRGLRPSCDAKRSAIAVAAALNRLPPPGRRLSRT